MKFVSFVEVTLDPGWFRLIPVEQSCFASLYPGLYISPGFLSDGLGPACSLAKKPTVYVVTHIPSPAAVVFPCKNKSHKMLPYCSHKHLMAIWL